MPRGEQIDRHEEETLGPTLSFGNYNLLEPIGERGGMGIVYRAIQLHPRREVALKRIKTGVDASQEHIARFKLEVESVANFDHPNIVRIFEFGEHDGELFYSMQLVRGGSLHRKLQDEHLLSCRSAATIIRSLAVALTYAHERKIIHRDLKPPNILFDDEQRPLIIDFGCAKRLETEANLTADGAPLGTWRYMPPEQAERPGEVDERADIFSLGAVLYECLVGRPPYQAASVLDTIKHLRDPKFEPPLPRELNPEIDRNLEAICMECIKKDPSQRYQTARALADDLDRYLDGQAPSVRPLTPARRLLSWCLKNVAVAGLAILSIVLGVVIMCVLFVMNRSLTLDKLEILKKNEENGRYIEEISKKNEENNRYIEEIEQSRRFERESKYLSRISAASQAWNDLRVSEAQQILGKLKTELADFDQVASWEWDYLQRLTDTDRHATILSHSHEVRCVDVSPNGAKVVFADTAGKLNVCEFRDESLAILENHEFDSIADIALSPDGRIAVGTEAFAAEATSKLHVIHSDDQWSVPVSKGNSVTRVAFSPDGEYIVVATKRGSLFSYYKNGRTGGFEPSAHDGAIDALDIGLINDIPYVLTGGDDHKVRIWQLNLSNGEFEHQHTSSTDESDVISLAMHPFGDAIAAGTLDGRLYQWDVNPDQWEVDPDMQVGVGTWKQVHSKKGPVFALAYNRLGTLLLTAGDDRVIRTWNPDDVERTVGRKTRT